MDNTINIALVGVGGQGTLLASQVIARAAMLSGMDVKQSEVHGMAQRGGSVVSQVRIGTKVYSPLIPDGETHFLLAFEMLESLRYAETLAADGTAFINRQLIMPVTVSSGQQPWLDDLDARLDRAFPHKLLIDALAMAETLGNLRTVNMIMTGALSCLLPLEETVWQQAIRDCAPAKHVEVNLAAFAAGRGVGSEQLAVSG